MILGSNTHPDKYSECILMHSVGSPRHHCLGYIIMTIVELFFIYAMTKFFCHTLINTEEKKRENPIP